MREAYSDAHSSCPVSIVDKSKWPTVPAAPPRLSAAVSCTTMLRLLSSSCIVTASVTARADSPSVRISNPSSGGKLVTHVPCTPLPSRVLEERHAPTAAPSGNRGACGAAGEAGGEEDAPPLERVPGGRLSPAPRLRSSALCT